MTTLLAEPKSSGPRKEGADFYELHPLLEIFPLPPLAELNLMADDLRRAGGCRPLLVHGGKIIDDRSLLEACRIAGVDVDFQEWDGFGSLAVTVARHNVPRSHSTDSQRAMFAADIADALSLENSPHRTAGLKRGAKSQKTAFPAKSPVGATLHRRENGVGTEAVGEGGTDGYIRCAQIAGEVCHIGHRSVCKAKKLKVQFPELAKLVGLGKLTLDAARLQGSQKIRLEKLSAPPIKPAKPTGEIVICGDCLKVMPTLADGRFDLAFIDPPYNIDWKYDGMRDKLSREKYLGVMENIFRQTTRLLKPTGSIFVLISWHSVCEFGVMLKKVGLHLRMVICWDDGYPMDSVQNFPPSGRFILYLTKHPKHFTWNPDDILIPSARSVLGDNRRAKDGVVPFNVWRYHRITGNSSESVPFGDAPPQVPDALLRRIVLAASSPGDEVLDPQCGNGTMGKAAIALGRKFLGIERSELYAKQAREWIGGAL